MILPSSGSRSHRRLVTIAIVFTLTAECKQWSSDGKGKQPSPFSASTVKNAASKLGGEAKKVGEAAWGFGKDAFSGILSKSKEIYDSVSGPLGPEECDAEEGFSIEGTCSTKENCPLEEGASVRDEDLKGEENFDLAETSESEGLFSQVFNIASSSVSTVYNTAKENIYDNGARLIKNFSEAVRSVISEELYTFLASMSSSLGDALLKPGASLYFLGERAMTITLLLLCVLFSYILLFRVSLLLILGMDAAVFLLHQIMGPLWIFDWLLYWTHWLAVVLWWMLAHYYVSSVLLVAVFVYSVVFPLVRRCTVRQLHEQLDDIERRIVDISERLREMEERQIAAFREFEQRQLQVIEMLRN